jgi:hypothetical protein
VTKRQRIFLLLAEQIDDTLKVDDLVQEIIDTFHSDKYPERDKFE